MTAATVLHPNTAILIDHLRAIVGDSGIIEGDALTSRYPGYFMERIGADAIVRLPFGFNTAPPRADNAS